MAIINSYPTITPTSGDLLLISDTSVEGNPTKTATVSSILSLSGGGSGTVTSVGLTMPAAFAVANSPVTSSGVIAVTPTGGAAGQFLDYTGNWSTPAGSGSGTVSQITFTAPLTGGTITTTGTVGIPQATSAVDGFLDSADWTTFNGKQDAITLTTTGTTGAATLVGSTLNIPIYTGGGGGSVSSVGLSMPAGFIVSSSPVTGSGTIGVAGAGTSSQVILGDGTLGTLNAGTVTSVAATVAGSSLAVSGSPITNSGTLAFTWSGSTSQLVDGTGALQTIPKVATYFSINAGSIINSGNTSLNTQGFGSITASGNLGVYTITFGTTQSNTNYLINLNLENLGSGGTNGKAFVKSKTTSGFIVQTMNNAGSSINLLLNITLYA